MEPKLSIIIPVYNVEKYLKKCLDSIYSLEINKEVLLINDGSTDNSLKILEEYTKRYNEITKLINQENKGVSESRNVGLINSSGEYIYFLDSDDWIEKINFEKFYRKILENKQLEMIIGKGELFLEKTGEKELGKPIPKKIEGKIYSGKEILISSIKEKFWSPHVSIRIMKKTFLLENKLFFEKGRVREDEIFSLKSLNKAKYVICYDEQIFFYRQREMSIMRSFNMKHAYDIFENLKDLIEEFKEEKNLEVKRVVFYKIKRYYKSVLKYALRYNDEGFYNKVLKEFKKDCEKYFFKIKSFNFDILEIYFIYKYDKLYFYFRNKNKKYKKD